MMKKICTFSLAILFASVASAQISKGSLFLGGQISGSKNEFESSVPGSQTESKGFTFSPAIGTAIQNNLILGIDFVYGRSENEHSNETQENRTTGGGVFLRKYVPLGKRFYFFGQARAGYTNNNNEHTSFTSKTTTESSRIDLSLYPGVSFALTKSLHIEAGFNNMALISYESGEQKQTNGSSTTFSNEFNSLGFSTNVGASNITFGFRFIIPKN